jgi:hypothetical protein
VRSINGDAQTRLTPGDSLHALSLHCSNLSNSRIEGCLDLIARFRRFMPKIPILTLCGRYNLLIPVFCIG